jgi:phosphoenolpyruvate carboxylase
MSLDFAEAPAPRAMRAYAREHAEVFAPMSRMYDCIREISMAVTHEVGAFG